MKGINGWEIEWEKDINSTWAIRFYKFHDTKKREPWNLQISKYRDADDFDRHMGNKYDWHGKWYVNLWEPEKTHLFDTKAQAIAFATKYMREH